MQQIWQIKQSFQSTVNVKVGDTVVWTNDDPVIHTIVEKEVMGFFSTLIFCLIDIKLLCKI